MGNREAFSLAWSFFKGNYALNFATIALLILFYLLGMIPILGVLFVMGYSVLELSVQIYFGKAVMERPDPESLQKIAAQTKISELLTQNIAQAAGGFLAFFLLSIALFFVASVLFSLTSGAQLEALGSDPQVMEVVSALSVAGLILFLLIGFALYIFPAVMGEVIASEDFVSAFKAAFLLFAPSIWKRTFNRSYFLLILLWSLILTLLVIVLVVMMGTLILIPVALVLLYIISLYNAAIYVFARELAK